MPFSSAKQRRWMFANKPEMAREWVEEEKALKKKKKKKAEYDNSFQNSQAFNLGRSLQSSVPRSSGGLSDIMRSLEPAAFGMGGPQAYSGPTGQNPTDYYPRPEQQQYDDLFSGPYLQPQLQEPEQFSALGLGRDLAKGLYVDNFTQPGMAGLGGMGLSTIAKWAPGTTTAAKWLSSSLPGHAGRAAFANSPGALGHMANTYGANMAGKALTWGNRARALGAAGGAGVLPMYGAYVAGQAPIDAYNVAAGNTDLGERTAQQNDQNYFWNVGQNLLNPGYAAMQYGQGAFGGGLDRSGSNNAWSFARSLPMLGIGAQAADEWWSGGNLDKQIEANQLKQKEQGLFDMQPPKTNPA